ncbi:MarR family winged helix-turn-helix transcriptional regulator [Bacillus piscicola]|uniref:MarR family winged helix-turn-helix transcriptional regulator n=1 Tax=Bacillus piscicola TaxID=1632684 RepID=UPI001F09A366|nr:MarR family transcriptional regulator [Bacillus piscicola]
MNENNKTDRRSLELMQSFWQIEKLIMKHIKHTAAQNNLSVPQFIILITMTHYHQIAQKKLQERTSFPKSTLSHAIDGLVQKGLLHRTYAKDNRREMDLSLSNAGKERLDRMKTQKDSVPYRFQQAAASFSDDTFRELLAMHAQIAAYVDQGSEE